MKLRPLHDWVVVVRNKSVEHILWERDKPSNQGTVAAIGPEVKEVCVGNQIQFNPYAGFEVSVNGWIWLFINEAEVSFIF